MSVQYIPGADSLSNFDDYSRVSVADGLVAVAGQSSTDGTDPGDQVRVGCANVGKALGAVGLGFEFAALAQPKATR
ncbi:RidA family protein [Mycobacterium sp. ITM-2016-00317]|uniref:RidA family protein n=1 Tax=Mycobacterium sp. ITM-2016-00317 TaxID=2099694 RepID=UPI00287F4FEC|nr:RidA family protein [Mycobacterium sp. ITM-2016-00317]WNG87814.1 RidA family protein [Mycobacterium sp. ITM-2016-00317]